MKKKILILLLTIVSLLLITNQYSEDKDDYIRTIYVEDNNQLYSYINEKYDLKNNENEIITIDESFSLEGNSIKSLSSTENYININLLIDKIDANMKLEYEIVEDGNVITDLLNLSFVLFNDEIYIVSRYAYIRLSDLDEYKNVKKCRSTTSLNHLLFKDVAVYGGGGTSLPTNSRSTSPASSIVVGVVGAGIAGGVKGLIKKLFIGTSYTQNTNTTTTTSTATSDTTIDSKKKLSSLKFNSFLKDYLGKHEDNYGWTEDELKSAFNAACKQCVNGKLIELDDYYKDEKPLIVLGKYLDNSEESYDKIASKNESSIVYSMDYDNWELYIRKYTKPGMLFLNIFFLDFWISRDCNFLLTRNPKCYLKNIIMESDKGYFYYCELQHISMCGYTWNDSGLGIEDETCAIIASRNQVPTNA